ncbi:MAG: tetratricopeptide repeat protein [Bacteroidales bacterium]|nr:tetratricopeptide repeat protein [Bacteroidales bacterium]
MKRILITLAAVILSAGIASAQDMSQATETAKMANESLQAGNNELALTGFQEALALAQACGEDGAELVNTCKGIIPQIIFSIAKGNLKAGEFDAAVEKLKEAAKTATEYAVEGVADEATSLIPQAYMGKGNAMIKDKNFAAAADAYKLAVEADPANGNASLRLGQALAGAGKVDEAIEAFKAAAENGQADNANKQLSNIYLKKAQADLKASKFKEAIADCEASNGYVENANAYKLAASAATKLNDSKSSIAYYEKYLEVAPTAKDANQIAFTVGALYQKAGNNAKAKEYYTKVLSDPQLGAQAKQLVESLK